MSSDDFFNNFKAQFAKNKNFVSYQTRSADLETPVSAYLKLRHFFPQSLLYESVEKAAGRGRYSIIACDPSHIWRCHNDVASITHYNQHGDTVKTEIFSDVTASLRDFHTDCKVDIPSDLPSAASGLFGYFSYDMVRFFEKLPPCPPDTLGIPDAVMWRPRIVMIFDSVYDTMHCVQTYYTDSDMVLDSAFEYTKNQFDMIWQLLSKPVQSPLLSVDKKVNVRTPKPHMSPTNYQNMVKKSIEYIYAGDAFQIVPSQRFEMDFEQDSFLLYRQLRRVNPSPYMFHACFDDFALVGASPEILVRVKDNDITIRPIAGTRPRGHDMATDMALEQELLSDEKECAEHLMLLDLGRNDVGRVSDIGTVRVTEEFVVERYSHVMHIVSNVTGRLKSGYDFLDALFSALPAGTVSGAPKIRAMEIINEIEPEKRSFYAGGIGYFSGDGNGDFALMLRTGLIKDNTLFIQAGAGVVADSIPENEHLETINKSMALVRAASLCGE
jgi:anthranilate synthase component I